MALLKTNKYMCTDRHVDMLHPHVVNSTCVYKTGGFRPALCSRDHFARSGIATRVTDTIATRIIIHTVTVFSCVNQTIFTVVIPAMETGT